MTHVGNVISDLRIREYFRNMSVLSDEGSRVCNNPKAVFLNFGVAFLDSYLLVFELLCVFTMTDQFY